MRPLVLTLFLAASASAQDIAISVTPPAVYVENLAGNIAPMERVFFHIIIENNSQVPVDIQWVRFDIVNMAGIVFSGQYSGEALIKVFDNAMDRRRIAATTRKTLNLKPGERKAISDILMELPAGFLGENLLVQVDYQSAGKGAFSKTSIPLKRMQTFTGRLPFDGVWYIAAEHGSLDPHKRFLAEAFAYDFTQIGAGGYSFQRDGKTNTDYYAYGKKVLAAKDGTVVYVRSDVAENMPGETVNTAVPGGNVVVIDHGNGQYGYYAHLKPASITVKVGNPVKMGQAFAEVGNTGDSVEPHLHFHVMDKPDPGEGDGIPAVFENWKAQSHGRLPSARQLGILPKGEFVQP